MEKERRSRLLHHHRSRTNHSQAYFRYSRVANQSEETELKHIGSNVKERCKHLICIKVVLGYTEDLELQFCLLYFLLCVCVFFYFMDIFFSSWQKRKARRENKRPPQTLEDAITSEGEKLICFGRENNIRKKKKRQKHTYMPSTKSSL